MCWLGVLVDVYWCTEILVDVLNWHVGWLLLMHWRAGWYVESTCCLTYTDWCIDVLVGVSSGSVGWRLLIRWRIGWLLNRHANFELFCSTQLLWSVAFGYNKKQEIKAIPLLHIQSWLKSSYCCSHSKKYKTQHNLNRGTMQYIPVKQAW